MTAETLQAIRHRIRVQEYGNPSTWGRYGGLPGGCAWVTSALAAREGWSRASGCYVDEDGKHYDHVWNTVGGLIVDATADQFGVQENHGVIVTSMNDSRYQLWCSCPEHDPYNDVPAI